MNGLWLPTLKKEIVRPWFLPSKETLEEQEVLLRNTYFLVKQGGFGERLRCTQCNGRHDYITLMCVERPFLGVTGGLYAYYRLVKDNDLMQYLRPEERARMGGVIAGLGNLDALGKSHPGLSRQLAQELSSTDMQIGAFALGVLEGIASTHAAKLVQRINDRGLRPKLSLGTPPKVDGQRNAYIDKMFVGV